MAEFLPKKKRTNYQCRRRTTALAYLGYKNCIYIQSPLACKGIQPVNPKGNQSWIFFGRTDAEAEAEAPILWPPDAKSQLIRKDPDGMKDWRQEEKGTKEDEMVGWHHRLTGHEFEQAPGVGEGQGSLVCCSPRLHKESDMTEQLSWTTLEILFLHEERHTHP